MIVSGQEKSGKNKLFQCLGKVREFQFESGKIYRYIFETSQGKFTGISLNQVREKWNFKSKGSCSSCHGPLDG